MTAYALAFLFFSWGLTGSLALWYVSRTAKSSHDVVITANDVLWQTRTTVRDADHLVSDLDYKAGVLAFETHILLTEAVLTAKEARLASVEERKLLHEQMPLIIEDAKALLASLKNTSDDTDKDLKDISDQLVVALDALTQTSNAATAAGNDISNLVKNPAITDTLHHVDLTTEQLVAITTALNKIAGDIQGKVHQITNPTKKKRIKADIIGAIQVIEDILQIRFYSTR